MTHWQTYVLDVLNSTCPVLFSIYECPSGITEITIFLFFFHPGPNPIPINVLLTPCCDSDQDVELSPNLSQ